MKHSLIEHCHCCSISSRPIYFVYFTKTGIGLSDLYKTIHKDDHFVLKFYDQIMVDCSTDVIQEYMSSGVHFHVF